LALSPPKTVFTFHSLKVAKKGSRSEKDEIGFDFSENLKYNNKSNSYCEYDEDILEKSSTNNGG